MEVKNTIVLTQAKKIGVPPSNIESKAGINTNLLRSIPTD
jgi:hypothetical protein